MSEGLKRSVITCDMEGRIETFSPGAELMFGYTANEVVGKKRVSIFSPGLVVLGHVGTWLKRARTDGAYETQTVFVRKDGTPFAADFKITPTSKQGKQIGYCGVTIAKPDVVPSQAMPRVSFGVRLMSWLVITRAPFLTASIIPVLIGAAWATRNAAPFSWGIFSAVLLGAVALHLCGNTFNDYFDWTSGTDEANTEYFGPISGGSRAVELGLITPKGLLKVALGMLAVATAAGLWLISLRGIGILYFGLAGAFAAFFYTAPPLRLVARKGLGELLIGLTFGPLIVAGTSFSLTGAVSLNDFLVGLPIGLLTSAILYVNEFPDARSDATTGKNHLVVVLGKEKARFGYAGLVIVAFGIVPLLVALRVLPLGALASLLALPLALRSISTVMKHFDDRQLVKANVGTIQFHALAGVAMALGIAFIR